MKRTLFSIIIACMLAGSGLFAVGEKTFTIGAGFGWEAMERRTGVTEIALARPHTVLALSSLGDGGGSGPDAGLYLSFDEAHPGRFADSGGHWQTTVTPALGRAGQPWVRAGSGAAQFTGEKGGRDEGPLILRPGRGAVFAPGARVGDFSIEFWLMPLNLENGEQILTWSSSRPDGRGGYIVQRIQCIASKNRLQWTFSDFFSDPAERQRISLVLTGAPVLPKAWAHHLIRFDADVGLLEYLVDGRLAALDYATSSGREGGEVYTPVMGDDGSMVLGERYSGLMDEFRVYGQYAASPVLARYPREGRAETRTIDLGQANSKVLKIEAFGGRSISLAGDMKNIYAGNGNLNFSDYAELRFFVRVNDTPYRWNEAPWVPVAAGADLGEALAGRYIQVAADFYPSGNGEATPYLDELRIVYQANEPPPPPALVTAIAKDGAVELSWKPVPSRDVGGYVIYYGTSSGEYFGEHAILDGTETKSPINAGLRNSVRIEGLRNGTLYYFAVAAYDKTLKEVGMFSREAAARPLRQPLQGL
ncbi:hypothetical protein FACS189447_05990 [Spirochaetia bacterium]|nr:hypothetical protein FACS189447_05990 [Spirochaetia bacterium]